MQEGYRSPIPKQLQWRSWASDPEGITGDELLAFVNTELFPKLKGLSVACDKNDRRRVVRDVFEDAYNYMKSGQLTRQVVNKINEVDFNNLAERQHFGDIYEQILIWRMSEIPRFHKLGLGVFLRDEGRCAPP